MTKPVLGFVGLGRMGALMAQRLVDAGYPLVGYDRLGVAARLPAGATGAESVAEVAARAEIALLCLPDGHAARLVCGEIAVASPRRVRTVAELSTIGIEAARECEALLGEAGLAYADAAVSGGVAGARAGTLTMMVGTPEPAFVSLKPVLEVLSARIVRMGDRPGLGQAMKLVNNFLGATALAATSEAVVLGAKLGLDLGPMVEVINASTGRSAASMDKFPRSVVPRTYDFGFAGALMTKDVGLYLETAVKTGTPRSLATAVAELWQQYNRDCPGTDFTYIHKYLEDMAGD